MGIYYYSDESYGFLWNLVQMESYVHVNFYVFSSGKWGTLKVHHTLKRNKTRWSYITLFLYYMYWGLSALLKNIIRLQHLHGYKASRGGPPISHLFFADDSLVFCRATEEECQTLMNTFMEYQRASGQAVNFAAITFAKGIPQITQEILIRMTWIKKIGGFGNIWDSPKK